MLRAYHRTPREALTTVLELIQEALLTANIIGQGNLTPNDFLASTAFRALVGMIDTANADPLRSLTLKRSSFLMTPGKRSYTIGADSSLDINMALPPDIVRANGVYTSAFPDATHHSISVLEAPEYERTSLRDTLQAIPSALWYDRGYQPIPAAADPPSGSNIVPGFGTIWFVGVPNAANLCEFWSPAPLTQATSYFDDLVFPAGYYEFLLYGLTARLYPRFGRPPDAAILALYEDARRIVEAANATPAAVRQLDSGLPGSAGGYWDGRSNQ